MKKVTLSGILTNGIQIGLTNMASLLGAVVLWALTCWIPYINIGTTIALSTLPIQMANGTAFSPTSIFDKKYRQYMGEYFLTAGLMYIGILIATVFFIIPGLVLSISWGLSLYFLLDKQINPMDALMASNKATNGYKWTIFGAQFVLGVIGCILIFIFMMIPYIGWLLAIVVALVMMTAMLGQSAYLYRELSK